MSLRSAAPCLALVLLIVGCGGTPPSSEDAGLGGGASAGGRVGGGSAGGSIGGGSVGGGAAGGDVAGGSSGGGAAGGGAAGGDVGGGANGGGTAGGDVAGGSSGGGAAGGDGGGSVGGGSIGGGSVGGGSVGGGSVGGGSVGGGSVGGGSVGGGSVGGGSVGGGSVGGGSVGGGSVGGGSACLPSPEVCDGVDNNCNQEVDEGLTISCSADPDNDRYATSSAVTLRCPDVTRPLFGSCPVGTVAPAQSLGLDCAPTDATQYRLVPARTDADGDGRCVGMTTQACSGAALGAGLRDPATCGPQDDCLDSDAQRFQLLQARADADGDGRCVGPVAQDCAGATLGAGRRSPATCAPTDDCNDSSPQQFQLLSTRADSDGDSFCAGPPTSECTGGAPGTGRRLASGCLGDDCNDTNGSVFTNTTFIIDADGDLRCSPAAPVTLCAGNTAPAGYAFPFNCITQTDCNDSSAAVYQLLSVRLDADNDGYCIGPATSQCSGAMPTMGFRAPNACNATDDCRDSNPLATSSCIISNGYQTSTATKACAFVPPTETFTVSATMVCPLGFTVGTLSTQRTAGTGTCTALSQTSLSITCNGIDGATCRVVGACNAL